MILEILVLGGALGWGVRTFKRLKAASQEAATYPTQAIPAEDQVPPDASFVDPHSSEKPLDDKTINRYLAVTTASLGLAAVGKLYPPLALLAIPGMIYTSLPIHKNTYRLLKSRKVGIDTLLSLQILGFILGGVFFVSNLGILIYFLAKKRLNKVMEDSRAPLTDVLKQLPSEVWVQVDGVEVSIPFYDVAVGDLVVVNGGNTIPVDGVITEGMARIEQQRLTGEMMPVEKGRGEPVFAGTMVLSGKITIQVEQASDETVIAKIGQILDQSVELKSTVELQAMALADQTVAPTLVVSGLALPLLGVGGAFAVINSHFRDRMSIFAPVSILNFFKIASQHGILIKDGRSLDLLHQVDTIVFDKTGTLTEEQPTVGAIHSCSEFGEEEVLRYAAAAEAQQAHPIAKAILQKAEACGLCLPSIDHAEYQVGIGITVWIEQRPLHVGSPRLMDLMSIEIPPEISTIQEEIYRQGHSLVMVAFDHQVIGGIELIPRVRPEVKTVIRQLQQRPQITATYIISGDQETPTRVLAEELGIDHYFAETLPEQKAQLIHQLREEGRGVCYIGDGINDVIALKESQVSISLRGASTIATDTAQIIFMDQGLTHLDPLLDLGQQFQRHMKTTFTLQVIPTLIGIGGVFLLGFGLTHTIFLNIIAMGAGLANTAMPLLKAPPPPEDATVAWIPDSPEESVPPANSPEEPMPSSREQEEETVQPNTRVQEDPSRLTEASFFQTLQTLTDRDPDLAKIIQECGPPPMELREPGFPTLVHIILGQQLSLALTQGMFDQLCEAVAPLTPSGFLELDDATLKAVGFNRLQVRYCRQLSEALLQGELNLQTLEPLDDATVRSELIKIKGVGPWTADMYLLTALRRPDIWPSTDRHLAMAIQKLKKLPHRPEEDEMNTIANPWRPQRAVAARILWHDQQRIN